MNKLGVVRNKNTKQLLNGHKYLDDHKYSLTHDDGKQKNRSSYVLMIKMFGSHKEIESSIKTFNEKKRNIPRDINFIEGEEWRDYSPEGCESIKVSSLGRISKNNKIIPGSKKKDGCLVFRLKEIDNNGYKTFRVHKIVLAAFTHEDDKKIVIHKNNIKDDNRLVNLEYATLQKSKTGDHKKGTKPVQQFDLKGNFIETYSSCMEAARKTNSDDRSIGKCCKGEIKTHNCYVWRYLNDDTLPPIEDEYLKRKPRTRRVNQYRIDGSFKYTFNSLKEAAHSVGLNSTTSISACCRNRQKSAGGFLWKYEN